MSLTKNQMVELSITGVTGDGHGVARYVDDGAPAGFVVFVPYTAIGDYIRCRIVKVLKTHAFGRVEDILIASPDRCNTYDCDVYGRCGGCNWRHVTYEAECRYKWQWVKETLVRVGGIPIIPRPLVAATSALRYRNKAQFPVIPSDDGPVMGFYAPRSHRVIACSDCALQPKEFAAVLDAVDMWMTAHHVSAYDETTHKGLVRHIYIRQGAVSEQMMVCLVCTSGKLPATTRLIESIRNAAPQLRSLVVNINPARTNVILGDSGYTLWGDSAIEDTLCGLTFRLSPLSFYQVNHAQTEQLYAIAAKAAGLTGRETVLDLYCGTGTIGLSMAFEAEQIIGVEVVPAAIEDARRNAETNGIANARFICADAATAAMQLAHEGVHPDVVVLDPPRKGCDAALIETVVNMNPSRIVYVSCNPATLARDLKILLNYGFQTQYVQPVDLFPRTAHVETVCLLSRKDK